MYNTKHADIYGNVGHNSILGVECVVRFYLIELSQRELNILTIWNHLQEEFEEKKTISAIS